MPNLVGIGLSQVPTNSMLGGLAYQSPDHASIKDLDLKNLSQINSEIAGTAVDIFIYDTSKDSDGGAWRKRTTHTSWYNETLNTSIRGSRREFPAVAVIVCGTDGSNGYVHIYDGDDPDLPMWMKFLGNNAQLYTTPNAVSSLNGTILVATPTYGLVRYDFIGDTIGRWRANTSYDGYKTPRSIEKRDAVSVANQDGPPFTGALVNENCNDVAMTVLPNAPIDSATGLPVPTIAVATNDGVSVIKDDGTVVDIRGTHGGNYNQTLFVDFDSKTNAIISGFDYGAGNTNQIYKLAVFPIPSADRDDDNNYTGYQHHYRRIQTQGNTTIPKLAGNYITGAISAGGDGRYAIQTTASGSYPTALNIIQEEPGTDGSSTTYPSNSRVAYATTSYNTGWMHGDIKGAFLSDTDATNVTGSELVSNGTFTDNILGWTDNSGSGSSISWSSGKIYLDGAVAYAKADQAITTVVGKTYVFSAEVSGQGGAETSQIWAGTAVNTFNLGYTSSAAAYNGVMTLTFTATTTTTWIRLYTGWNTYFDNVSVRIAEEDRSVNNKGLQVFGTVTKTPVATGAELVAYSGWSSSNYLIQPYNSALDFGTGDWCYMFWYNPNDAASGNVLFSRWSYNVNTSTAGRIGVYFNSGNLRFDTTDDAGSSYQGHVGSDGTQDSNTWHCGVILRRGNNAEIWVDGVRYVNNTLNSTSDGSYTNTSAILEIGNSPNMGSTDSGIQLALLRASASAPSPEQIKKIYEDEKVLFQENAACTLYGSSDAVTALAYDEVTDRLHVGTSSGRSDFQGLRRINNTTTAVTTAISAHDEFIVEQ